MPAKIYHWKDAQNKSHYSDHLPLGQIEVEREILSNDNVVTTNAPRIKTQEQYQGSIKTTPPITALLCIVIVLFFFTKWLKNFNKGNNKFKAERYKINENVVKDNQSPPSRYTSADKKAEKGLSGELLVNCMISSFLDKTDYRLINSVTLFADGGTTQIDHVVVSKYGIFVIETKNMSGWIFGGAKQKIWTQMFSQSKEKFRFQNPSHQNYKHTKTLQSVLGIGSNKLFSLVVFIGESQFKTTMPENIFCKDDFISFIKNHKNIILRDDDVIEIFNKIKVMQLKPTIKNHNAHIEYIEAIIKKSSYQ